MRSGMRKMLFTAACGVAMLGGAGAANAAVYTWEWNQGDPLVNASMNHNAGTILKVEASYNTDTEVMSWYVDFGRSNTWRNELPNGFTLAVNDGPNPKGHNKELALLYFDATNALNPKLTAYNYNGQNTQTSFRDGGGSSPIKIASSTGALRDQWIIDLTVDNSNPNRRRLGFTIDASLINDFVLPNPHPVDPWKGIQFAEELGLWMHPVAGLTTQYGSDGFLKSNSYGWKPGREGWFDGSFQDTHEQMVPVPAPGAALLGLMGMSVVGWVRKRNA